MELRAKARQLRKSMTHEEVKLWLQLKFLNKRGAHFRRQVPLDGYILDFADFKFRIIIEVDGSQHSEPEAEQRDRYRDRHFEAAGFRILRFWNFQINREMDGVIGAIENALK
ncbi:MAG: endonuclease domain-containing protein [Alphaproteobacteria bacterium]|nr:endonuclease domain-containing protein [Alphaproteobacteria bacterium]